MYKEICLDECKYIICILDVIFIKYDDDVIINEFVFVYMLIINDMDDYEIEFVVFWKWEDGEVELIFWFSVMCCEFIGNCYIF